MKPMARVPRLMTAPPELMSAWPRAGEADGAGMSPGDVSDCGSPQPATKASAATRPKTDRVGRRSETERCCGVGLNMVTPQDEMPQASIPASRGWAEAGSEQIV